MKKELTYKYSDNLLQHRNYFATYFVYLIFLLIICEIFFFHDLDTRKTNEHQILNSILIVDYSFAIISAIWAYKIAKRKNHFPNIWAFLSLQTIGIGLLIIANMDYNLKNPIVKRIVKKARQDYYEKIADNNNDKLQIIKEDLDLLEIKLKTELVKDFESLSTSNSATENSEIEQYVNDKINTIENLSSSFEKKDNIDWNPNWMDQENVCPACGAELNSDITSCNKCGLKVK